LISGTFQSNPGNPVGPASGTVRANPETGLTEIYNVTRTQVPNLTQPLVAVNLIPPGNSYLSRVNQLDMRFGRRFKLGTQTIDASVDIFNLLNVAPIMRQNETFGSAFGTPQEVLLARTARLTFNFLF
jgi:hypothetical protein